MEKKKVLFVNGHLNTGGVEKSLVDILQHFDYDQYDVDLLLTEDMGDYAEQLPKQVNVILRSIVGTYGSLPKVVFSALRTRDWFSLKMRFIFLLMKYFGIGRISLAKKMLTGNQKYDCAIGFRRGLCTQIATYATEASQRITWWHHGTFNMSVKGYCKEIRKCERIIAVSNACRQMLMRAIPFLESRLVTIYNILDADRIYEKAQSFNPHFDRTTFHIVSVGGLVPEKHFQNAIFTARQLKERGIKFQWHLIGDGVECDKLKEYVKEQSVEDVFFFEGNQANPYPFMKHADLFVHPSYVESFGIVVAEALALGLPCVVTKSTGVMDFLVNGENALLTEQNADDFAVKILKVLNDRKLYEKLRENSKLPEEFRPEAVMEDIYRLIET